MSARVSFKIVPEIVNCTMYHVIYAKTWRGWKYVTLAAGHEKAEEIIRHLAGEIKVIHLTQRTVEAAS